jgi:formate-dependent nitrite reductase membrane component NrfD
MENSLIHPTDLFVDSFKVQKEWIEGKGMLLLLAIFFGELGAGMFLVSWYLNFLFGMVLGIIIVASLKTIFHILFLGQPLKFWRAFTRPQSSWISRGVIIMSVFVVFGGLYVLPAIPGFSWLPWTAQSPVGNIILGVAIIAALGEIIYVGFLLASSPSIPFWNTGLLPILFVIYSLLDGAGLTFIISPALANETVNVHQLKRIEIWLTFFAVINILAYIWTMYHTTSGGKESVLELIKGRIATPFIGGVLIIGILIPLPIAIYAHFVLTPYTVLGIAAFMALAGGFLLRYSILKAGIFPPLYPLYTPV